MIRRLLLLLLLFGMMSGTTSAFISGYGYYQDATLNNGGASTLTNYPKQFTVYTSSGTSSGTTIYLNSHAQSDLDDLRFTTTGDTVYDYWIESTSSPYTVHVEISSITIGNSTFRVQYGNATATAYSNGTNTFGFFDHFDDGSINTVLWTTRIGTITESGTEVVVKNTAITTVQGIKSGATFGTLNASRFKAKVSAVTNNYNEGGFDTWGTAQIGWTFDSPAGYHGLTTYNGAQTTHAMVSEDTAYHVFDIKRVSDSSVKGNVDDGEIHEITTNIPTGALPVTLRPYAGTTAYPTITCDWFLVRQYTDTEPTVPAWSGELLPSSLTPFPGCSNGPIELDADGFYEDINGNSRMDWSDVILLANNIEWAKTNEPAEYFDFGGGGTIDWSDVVALVGEL